MSKEDNRHFLTDREVENAVSASIARSADRRTHEPLSRRDKLTTKAAVLAVAAGLGIVGGPSAAHGIESGVGAAGNAIERGVDSVANVVDGVDQASHDAASNRPVPDTQAALNAEAQRTIQADQNANRAHDQLQP